MNMPATDVNRIWVKPISENIPLSRDTVDGGKTKVPNRAQVIIRAHLADVQKDMNHLKLQRLDLGQPGQSP